MRYGSASPLLLEQGSRDPHGAIAVRGRAGGEDDCGEENAPLQRRPWALLPRDDKHRLDRENASEREPDREASVQIGPEHHQWHEPPGRRAPHGGLDEAAGPEDQNGKDEHMRPGVQAAGRQAEGEERDDEGGRRIDAAPEPSEKQRERGGDHDRGQSGDAAPARGGEGAVENELRQPFLRDPGCAREGVGEHIGPGHRAGFPDPASHGDMPVGVRVPGVDILTR